MSIGRNDYSQCAIRKASGGELISKPMNCLYKDVGCDAKPLIKPFKFTTGWFHSTFISNDQKRIYFTGYYSAYSSMGQTKDTCFYDITDTVLEKDMLADDSYKITDIGSGDHFFAFVVNNEFIVVVDQTRKVFHIPDLKEFLVFKSGVAFTRGNGNLYLAKNYPDSVSEYDGKFVKNLRSTSVADSFSFVLNGQNLRFGHSNQHGSIEIYESFCIAYLYDSKERKFPDEKFKKINEELEKHKDWEILQFITGSDSVHILLGIRETKEEQRFFEKLSNIRQGTHYTDMLVSYTFN